MMAAAATARSTVPLNELLRDLMAGTGDVAGLPITGVTLDSRDVAPGFLFIARAGSRGHGLDFLDEALERGAAAVLAEGAPAGKWLRHDGVDVPLYRHPDAAQLAGPVASRFFGDPSRRMHVIGVTGTNGKTSVSHYVAQALAEEGPCGLIGTLGSGLAGRLKSTGHTTPDAVTLQAELADLYGAGARWAVMEVSSHALEQARVAGVSFATAVFTNLSHDHLDYHGTMAAYAAAKRQLFFHPGLRRVVINGDDPVGREWLTDLPGGLEVIGYGLTGQGRAHDLEGREVGLSAAGLSLTIQAGTQQATLRTGLLGRFNAYNLLAALGALLGTGLPFETAVDRLERVRTVPGRMERFGGGEGKPLAVVDYAHTPDALEHVLTALAEHCRGRLWCVFGCGGDRDRGKRPLMGRIAERHADLVIVTDDNPRSEDPYSIIENILGGMSDPDQAYVIRDRGAAIRHALELAEEDDVVLVAGKGHETEQVIGDQHLPFSDRTTVARLLDEEVPHG